MSLDLVKPAQLAALAGPAPETLALITALERSEANHAAAMASLACLQRVEAPAGPAREPLAFPLTIAAWNLERCYAVEASAEILRREGAAIALCRRWTTAWRGPGSVTPAGTWPMGSA